MRAQIAGFLLLAVLLALSGVGLAQEASGEPRNVRANAPDGLMLVGDYWALEAATDTPAVLLMHMAGGRRGDWQPLVPDLLDAGYHVLSVDLRGHGETGGQRDWPAAINDVQTWLDWLREQPGVRSDAVSIVGASIGSNLALVGCANDADCLTAVALSPGSDYFGVQPAASLTDELSERSALLVASQGDRFSAQSVREFVSLAPGEVGARFYTGGAHGTALFNNRLESVTALVIGWLDEHIAAS